MTNLLVLLPYLLFYFEQYVFNNLCYVEKPLDQFPNQRAAKDLFALLFFLNLVFFYKQYKKSLKY